VQQQYGYVDPIQGSLKFSSSSTPQLQASALSQDKVKSITYETNFSKEYISSDTGIEQLLNILNQKSWSLTAKSPFVIKDSIFDNPKYSSYRNNVFVDPSAQVAITIELNSFYKIAKARLFSNAFSNLQLCQVIVETKGVQQGSQTSAATVKKALMTETKTLKNVIDFDFDQTYMIKSITLIIAQRSYTRKKNVPIQSEVNSKIISAIVSEIRAQRKLEHDSLQDYVIKFFLNESQNSYILRNKKLYSYNYTKYYPTPLSKMNFGVVEKLNNNSYYSDMDSFNKFKNTSLISNMIFSIITYTLGSKLKNSSSSTYIESNLIDKVKSIRSFNFSGLIPLGDSNIVDSNMHFFENSYGSYSKEDALQLLSGTEEINTYEYNFSFGNICLYEAQPSQAAPVNQANKSVFVSKRISTKGRALKAKMLVDYFNDLNKSTSEFLNQKTSIEYSVSIAASPSNESDWIPIIPFNESSVKQEILFFNNSTAILRFVPLPESVLVYENNIKIDFSRYTVLGKQIRISNYDNNKKYYVSYTPDNLNSNKEIELHSKYLSNPVLITPSYNGSNGESFAAARRTKVSLRNDPYVDYSKFQNASYSNFIGTVTSSSTSSGSYDYSSYSPIKIIFEDGKTAINITNYILDNYEIESFYETDEILFLHYGDTITFNKEVTSGFRVMYQYVPDSFRYRVVMRSLDNTAENYSVDRLIFKFSSEKRDQLLINLVKHDNIFKNKVN
jgi:hypothetical protein